MLTKKLYEQATGRSQKSNIIAYQIRQSFRPGEITAEEANRIGYELASRFLKGKHAFIVATHTDREHIHNHIMGKQMVRVAMNTSNFLGQTSLCKSSIAQSRMCCIALFSASGNPSVQKVPIPQASALRLKSIFQKCAACIHWMQNTRGLGTAQQAF